MFNFSGEAKTLYIFSSPETSGSQGELILYPCSVVRRCRRCRPHCSNISSETTWPIKAKFQVYINCPGNMTKMAAMPIYGKNL